MVRVLVVDDCRDNRESLVMLLGLWGHEARVAHDGPSALAANLAFCPHVLLVDIGLPGMDGWEVARRIREEHSSDVLLVALTGFGQEQDKARSRQAGFDVHLTKPVDPQELERLLSRGLVTVG